MPVDSAYKALGWSEKEYSRFVGKAGLDSYPAMGVPVQKVCGSRPWVCAWTGGNGKFSTMGVRVYSNGAIQGYAADDGQGAGFSSYEAAVAASEALGYAEDWVLVVQFEGQLGLFSDMDL